MLGAYTKYPKEEESLFQVKINPRLSLLSQHTHTNPHRITEEFSLIGILSGLCVCVNTTGENMR